MNYKPTSVRVLPKENKSIKNSLKYNVEFFHIYTDQKISPEHIAGIEYLKTISKDWDFEYELIILIDDYNPLKKIISTDEIINYLDINKVMPDYYAFEKDMVNNANELIKHIDNKHLKRSYEKYISKSSKYPCSLLTATWYLTRLGRFEAQHIIHNAAGDNKVFCPADRLVNILPENYKAIEERASNLIAHSAFTTDSLKIENIYIPINSNRIQKLM